MCNVAARFPEMFVVITDQTWSVLQYRGAQLSGAAAFVASFGPFWLCVGVRDRCTVRVESGLGGSTPVP